MQNRFKIDANYVRRNSLRKKIQNSILVILISRKTFVLMKTSWRRLSSSSSEDTFKTSWRRLDQDKYIRHSHTSLDVWSRSIYSSLPYVFKTSSRRFQDVFKTSSRCLAKTSLRRLQNVLKTSCKNVFKTSSEDIFKSSPRHLQDFLQKYLQDVFKTYHQVKLFLLASLEELFNTFLRRTAKTVMYRSICLGPISEKFMIRVQNLQERWKFLKF